MMLLPKKLFVKILLTGVFLWGIEMSVSPARINVFPEYSTKKINKQLEKASPGDSIFFNSGTYKGPFILEEIHGAPNLPIVFTAGEADAGSVIIDGQTEPGSELRNNAFNISNSSWITIEGFTIKNCWLDIISASDVSYLSLKSCSISGGKRVVFAKGRGSHHFLVEDCRWEQDERVWTHEGDYSWEEIHHGVHSHFNGSLFQGSIISGVFVLRNNHIQNTFNAFRLSQINDGSTDSLACSNGEIYGNYIRNTSDNVFEPEVFCHNLHFYHNHMVNGHALISVTDVGGGPLYLYGNTGLSEPDCKDGWSIFKLSMPERALSKPFYVFNNSWYVDYNFVGDYNAWRNKNSVHFNNAYIVENLDTFGLDSTGFNNSFDYDCSLSPFPPWFRDEGVESHGIEADPMFREPLDGDFRLQDESPCIDRGLINNDLILSYQGKAPDIGAWEGEHRVNGPAFRYSDPGVEVPYKEHSRISKYSIQGDKLICWFSIPVPEKEITRAQFSMEQSGNKIPLEMEEVKGKGYMYAFSYKAEINPHKTIYLKISDWPIAVNGIEMTSWASAIPVSKID